VSHRAVLPLALWLVLLIACAAIIFNSRFVADMSAFLPRAPDSQQQVLVDQLRDGTVSRLIFAGIDGASADVRAELSRSLARRLRASGDFVSVNNGEPVNAERDYALLFHHRYLLSSTTTPEAFTAEGLHRAIGTSIAQLASPFGDGLKSLLPADPTGATLNELTRLSSGPRPHEHDGVWTSHDESRALLLMQTRATGIDTDAQQAAINQLRSAFAAVQKTLGPKAAQTRLVFSGPGVFAVESRAAIKGAVERVSMIGSTLIIVLLLLVYRSPTVLLLGLLPVLSGIVAAVAAVSLGYGVVQGVTLGFGTTLMGEAVDYSIYLFVQSGKGGGDNTQHDWLQRFWPTIRLGMLTSIVGFGMLLLSDFPGLAQLGAYSIAGLITAGLVTRFVLPQLLPRNFMVRDLSTAGRVLMHGVAVLRRLRWLLLVLVAAAALVLLMQRHHFWDTRLSALSPIPPAARALDAQLRSQLGGPSSGDLVAVSGDSAEAALAAAEAVAPRLQDLQAKGVIAGFDSPAHYLPSLATQRARQAALPDSSELQQRLDVAVQDLHVKAGLFAPFIKDVETARSAKLLTRADLAGTSFALAVDGMLLHGTDNRWTALLPLRARPGSEIDGRRTAAALSGSGAHYINLGEISDHLYDNYLHTAAWLSLSGLGATAILLLTALRSPLRVSRVLAPLLAAVVVVAAGLQLTGTQLTLLHLVGMMLIVAVGSNYALFFDRGNAEGTGIDPRTLASLVFANLTTVAGFGPLLFSGVPVLTSLGATIGPGALLALLFSAMLSSTTPSPNTVPKRHNG
jgi:predicted exporter